MNKNFAEKNEIEYKNKKQFVFLFELLCMTDFVENFFGCCIGKTEFLR